MLNGLWHCHGVYKHLNANKITPNFQKTEKQVGQSFYMMKTVIMG